MLGNVVSRERFKLVYNTSETVSETMKSGYGVEPDDVPMSRDAKYIQSADYTDGPETGPKKLTRKKSDSIR